MRSNNDADTPPFTDASSACGMRKSVAAGHAVAGTHAQSGEALIRTLSVSLVAVAAIAASLLLTRNRDEGIEAQLVPSGGPQQPGFQLDAIRAAGL
jgi:hypothetical protein